MPRANPAASFEVAIRHLFRHLNDPERLRSNPLAKRFFESRRRIHQKGALLAIRSLIDAAAKAYRDVAAPDERPKVERQLTILYGCIKKQTVKQMSSQLGVSVRQCYRERSAIYRYVAEFIRHHDLRKAAPVANIASPFEVEMERAALRAENGDYDQAIRAYTSLVSKGATRQKLEAFNKRVELELELGSLRAAESLLSDLAVMLKGCAECLSETEIKAYSAQIDLLGARLAWELGSFEVAFSKLFEARDASLRFRDAYAGRFRGLYADIALTSANRAFEVGDFDSARIFLRLTRDADSTVSISSGAAANVSLIEAMLNVSTMRPGAEVTLRDQIDLVNQAQAIALQCGSLKWRLQAEVALTMLRRSSENVLEKVELILSVAKGLRNPRLFATLSLELADLLLETPFWRRAKALFRVTLPRASLNAGYFSLLKAVYYLKAGSAATSLTHAKDAYAIAKAARALKLQASTLRLLAEVSHDLGYDAEAADYILSALPLAERYASAPVCLKVYRSAALITGSRKYAREAKMLALALQQ